MKPFEHPSTGGTFYLGMNFESQSHKSHLAESGVNTLAQNMYIHCQFPGVVTPFQQAHKISLVDATSGDFTYVPTKYKTAKNADSDNTVIESWQLTNQQMTIDHYAHYDGLLIIVNGVASTRF